MARAKHTYAVRMAVEDGGKVKAELVEIGATGDRSLRKIETASGHASRGLAGLGDRTRALGLATKALNGVLAAAAGGAGLALMANRAITAADAVGKTADKIGVGVEALQELRYAAQSAGIEEQTLDMALQRFTRRVAEAAKGTGEAKNALAEMGIALHDQSGRLRRTEDLLSDVADGFLAMEDAGHRVRIAQKLFDSEGVAMVNVLAAGSVELERMRARARDLGIVLSEHTVRDAERARNEMDTLAKVISQNLTNAILDLAPLLADASAWFADFFANVGLGYENLKLLLKGDFGLEDRGIRNVETKIRRLRAALDELRDDRRVLVRPSEQRQLELVEGRIREKEKELAHWEARLAELRKQDETPPVDSDSTITDVADAEARAKALLNIETNLQRQLFDATHQGAERIKAEHEKRVAELNRLRSSEGDAKVNELIAQSAAVRDAELARLGERELKTTARRIDANERLVEILRAEREEAALGERERYIAQATRRLSADATAAERAQVRELAGELFDERQAVEALREAREDGLRLTEQMRTAEEQYADEIARLNALLRAGAIDQETYGRAAADAMDRALDASRDWRAGVQRALRDFGDEAGDMANTFEQATSSALRRSEDAFVEWARTGKFSAADLFNTIAEEALRMAYRIAVLKPLSSFLESFLGNIASAGITAGGGGGFPVPSGYSGGGVDIGRGGGPFFSGHIGGQIGGPNAFGSARVSPAVFADAPHFATGGLVGGEVPIVAHRGEVVGWPEQMRRAFGGSEVTVQVIDQRRGGAPAETSRERGPDGREVIRVLIRDEVGRGIAQGWWDQSMAGAYGLNRRGATR